MGYFVGCLTLTAFFAFIKCCTIYSHVPWWTVFFPIYFPAIVIVVVSFCALVVGYRAYRNDWRQAAWGK